MPTLKDKIALVTGSSKGIGAAIARALAAAGATVIVNYSSSKQGADTTVAAITQAGGKAVALGGSVAKTAEIDTLFAEIKRLYGRLDILVNNAGVYQFSPIEAITEEEIDRQFGVNVKGLLLTTKAAVPLFPATGGSIINLGSTVSETTPAMSAIYTGTKGAVDAITRVLARELGSRNIRVNALNPGLTVTEGVKTAGFDNGEFTSGIVAQTPLGRLGQPEDIADVAVFLASDQARWITGSLLQAGGGLRS